MSIRHVSLLAIALVGCTGAASSSAPQAMSDARVDRLLARAEASDRRASELETRLAMLEAEARTLRAEVAQMSVAEARRSVRIGESRRTSRAEVSVFDDEGDAVAEAPRERVVLRLVGEPAVAPARAAATFGGGTPSSLPEVPVVTEALPVTGAARGAVPPISAAQGLGAMPAAIDATAEYRAALALITAQEFSRAYEALSRFVERHPGHGLADSALYWRAETWYLQGEYARAVREYDALVTRYPAGRKAAEALLRAAACHARLGNRSEAQAALERVRREYPSSDAARRASDRDAT